LHLLMEVRDVGSWTGHRLRPPELPPFRSAG